VTGNGALSVIESGKALVKNSTELVCYPAASGSITLSSITTIGGDAFSFCTGLTSVSLPAATSIGSSAFYECTGLTSVNLPAATDIDVGAFQYTGSAALSIIMKNVAPTVGPGLFAGIYGNKTVTVNVPSGASGYDPTWVDNFKGGNSNITVNVVEIPGT
jgi:hypothetical protein